MYNGSKRIQNGNAQKVKSLEKETRIGGVRKISEAQSLKKEDSQQCKS